MQKMTHMTIIRGRTQWSHGKHKSRKHGVIKVNEQNNSTPIPIIIGANETTMTGDMKLVTKDKKIYQEALLG